MQNASEEREKTRKQVVTLIRSLLISTKGGVPIEKINRDYREMIGKPIPYRDLGYVSLDEFLDQSPDMCRVSYTQNGIMLHGVATAADAHVASLVSRQTSKKKARPTKPPARRPNSMRPSWQPPTPSQPLNRVNNRFHPGGGSGSSGNRRPGGSGRFPVIQNRSPQSLAPYQQQRLRTPNYPGSQHTNMNVNGGGGGSSSSGMMPMMSNNRRPMAMNQQKPQNNHQYRQQNYQSQQQSKSQQHHQNSSSSNSSSKSANQVNSIKILEQYFSQNQLGELTFKTASMEVKSGGGQNQKKKGITRFVSTVKVGDQSFQTFPNAYNSKEQAEDAAAALAISKMNISTNSQQQLSSNTNGNNNSVMSMPIGHFEDMSVKCNSSNISKSEEQDFEPLIDRIFELVGNRSNGVWSTQIDVEYKRKYQRTLPTNWPSMIEPSEEASKKLRVDNPIEGRYIIYPILNNPDQQEPSQQPVQEVKKVVQQNSQKQQPPPISTPPQKRPPKLVLPEDNNWDVYITCVHSTINVCLRILGDAYSTQFDDMVTNMELKYFESDQVPLNKDLVVTNAEVGKLYAAKVDGDWHRVEATNVHGLEVMCYFIDHGDEDPLQVKDLRHLLPEFLQLAPQARSVRLAGLEDLAGDVNSRTELTNAALGRSLVGQVHSMDEGGISLILYDTSNTDEDVNINEKILEKFKPTASIKNGNPPTLEQPASTANASSGADLPRTDSSASMQDMMSIDLASLKPLGPPNVPEVGEFLDVNITLAASPSNFTVQPWQNTTQLETFQAELNAFYHDAKNAFGRTLTNTDIANGDKFYAGQHMDGKWYRVKVNATIDEGTVAAKIVDFGDFTMIPLENLQPLWPQFRNLPMQAISASLADIVAVNGDWSTEDTIWFSERVVNSQFVTKIRDVTYDPLEDNVRISVSLIDTTHPTTDIYIEKQLVEDKRAVYLCV